MQEMFPSQFLVNQARCEQNSLHKKYISSSLTGGHNWFPFSSKAKRLDDGTIQVLRYGAWVTSGGFADFYVVECTSPSFAGDFMNLSLFLMFKV